MQLSRIWSMFRLADVCAYAPLILLGALALLVGVHPQLPTDDALRHVVSYAWGYSHTAMYPQSSLTEFNQYPLFDHVVGAASQAIGTFATLKLMQVLALLGSSWALYRAFSRYLLDSAARPLDATLLTLLVLSAGVLERALLARPEVFVMAWAVAWLGANEKTPLRWQVVLLLTGFALSTSYWLAWISWPLIWMAPFSARRRLGSLALLGLFHAAFWHFQTNGAYWQVFQLLTTWNANRLVSIQETKSTGLLLARPAVLALLGLAAGGFVLRPKGWGPGAVALLPYLALNMLRYVGSMLACLTPLIAAGWQRLALPVGARMVLGPVLLFLAAQGFEYEEAPDFKVPAGAVVLTSMSQATFAIPMANPGTVSTLPAMEVGASSQRVQAQVAALQKSTLNCSEVHALGVTHVVEKSWRGEPSPCLSLVRTKGAWRLWAVQ